MLLRIDDPGNCRRASNKAGFFQVAAVYPDLGNFPDLKTRKTWLFLLRNGLQHSLFISALARIAGEAEG